MATTDQNWSPTQNYNDSLLAPAWTYAFCFRRAAQYFFILMPTALRCAADIVRRLWCAVPPFRNQRATRGATLHAATRTTY
jgi:hypothetical protein